MTTKIKPKTIHFEDFPDFKPNLTPKQMKTLITRAGPGTKVVCLGNVAQPNQSRHALSDLEHAPKVLA